MRRHHQSTSPPPHPPTNQVVMVELCAERKPILTADKVRGLEGCPACCPPVWAYSFPAIPEPAASDCHCPAPSYSSRPWQALDGSHKVTPL